MENKDRLIEKMKQENIKPKPGWHFTAKGTFYWFLFIVSIILGALAFSVVLFSVQQLDFNLVTHMSHSRIEFLLGLLPFFWIVSLIIFLAIAMIGIKNSKRGYKYTYSNMILFSAVFSILMGTVFFIGGGGQYLENTFAVNVATYEGVNEKKIKTWMNPEEGYLAGTIIEVNEVYLELQDFDDQLWMIDFSQADIPNGVLLEEGESIKLIGKMVSNESFKADEIRRWGGNGRQGKRRREEKKR